MLKFENQTKSLQKGWLVLLVAVAAMLLASCKAAETGEEFTELLCEDGSKSCWAVIQPEILAGTGSCTACHTGTGAGPSDLSWEFDQYTRVVTDGLVSGYDGVGKIVNTDSTTPTDSFMYRKITNDLAASGEGGQMPPCCTLTQGDIDLIAEWISKGAPEL